MSRGNAAASTIDSIPTISTPASSMPHDTQASGRDQRRRDTSPTVAAMYTRPENSDSR